MDIPTPTSYPVNFHTFWRLPFQLAILLGVMGFGGGWLIGMLIDRR